MALQRAGFFAQDGDRGFDFGVINQLFGLAGLAGQDWLGEKSLALASVIVVDIWHWTPFVFLLLLAAIETLPQDVFEAARVDGASAWQELRHVMLPMLWPAIALTLLMMSGVAMTETWSDHARAAGFDDCIEKTASPSAWLELLERYARPK